MAGLGTILVASLCTLILVRSVTGRYAASSVLPLQPVRHPVLVLCRFSHSRHPVLPAIRMTRPSCRGRVILGGDRVYVPCGPVKVEEFRSRQFEGISPEDGLLSRRGEKECEHAGIQGRRRIC